MADRRSILRGLGALSALAAAPAVATPGSALTADPIILAHREWEAARLRYTTTEVDTAEAEDALYAAISVAERRAMMVRPCTVAGAVDALEWASAEMREWHDIGCQGNGLILALIDGALGVLRREVG